MTPQNAPFRARGFTLIELLVVISILGIAAAILFPVFARARDKARQAQCVSNMKQLAHAFAAYEQDNDMELPYWSFYHSSQSGDVSPNHAESLWFNAVYPYVKSTSVFQCQTANDRRSLRQTSVFGWIDSAAFNVSGVTPELRDIPIQYGYSEMISNGLLCATPNGACVDGGIDRPSESLLIADCAQGLTNSLGGRPDRNNPSDPVHQNIITRIAYANAPENCFADPLNCGAARSGPLSTFAGQLSVYQGQTRHVTGSNICFVDGHVKWMTSEQITFDLYAGDGSK